MNIPDNITCKKCNGSKFNEFFGVIMCKNCGKVVEKNCNTHKNEKTYADEIDECFNDNHVSWDCAGL